MKIFILVIINPLPQKKINVDWIAQYLRIFYWAKYFYKNDRHLQKESYFCSQCTFTSNQCTKCLFYLQPAMASSLSCPAVSEHPLWDWIPWEWSLAKTSYLPQPHGGCWRRRSDYPWKTAERGARNSTLCLVLTWKFKAVCIVYYFS